MHPIELAIIESIANDSRVTVQETIISALTFLLRSPNVIIKTRDLMSPGVFHINGTYKKHPFSLAIREVTING